MVSCCLKGGSAWYIDLTWPDGHNEQVDGFQSEAEIGEWIAKIRRLAQGEKRLTRRIGTWTGPMAGRPSTGPVRKHGAEFSKRKPQLRWHAPRRAILGPRRFHGSAIFVTEGALNSLQPKMSLDEDGMLRSFDSHRERIYAAAAKVYARGRKGSYDLEQADF